jgi:hypothetical protein
MKFNKSLLLATFSIGIASFSFSLFSQETQPSTLPTVTLSDQVTMKIGGFLRSDIYYDTRKNAELLDGLLDLYPLNKLNDGNGDDMNAMSPFRMSAAASRLNTKFTGPDVLGAKTTSLIEFDFTGVNGIGFRLRHAWLKLNWQNSEVLFGRFWHPMFILDAFPTVVGLSTGAPFNVFNRCEQLRYTYTLNQISIMGAASAQMDYGFQPDAAKNPQHIQVIPDLTANVQYKSDLIILGASANYKINQPKSFITAPIGGYKNRTYEQIASKSAQAYAQFKTGKLKIKGSVLYGENMYELLMLGGYTISSIDSTLNREKYSPMKNMNYWCNIIYGDKIQGGLFFGYVKNMGTEAAKVVDFMNARGSDIDNLIRIAPSITYKSGRVLLQFEIEHSIAAYGTPDKNDHGLVKNTSDVSNTRAQLSASFLF